MFFRIFYPCFVFFILITSIVSSSRVEAVSNPDTVEVEYIKACSSVQEVGDLIFVMRYYLNYISIPVETAQETFFMSITDEDGTVIVSRPLPEEGYGYNIQCIYLTADEVESMGVAWGQSYIANVMSNPTLFVTLHHDEQPMIAADWIGVSGLTTSVSTGQTNLKNIVMVQSKQMEIYYPTLNYVSTTSGTEKLTSAGSAFWLKRYGGINDLSIATASAMYMTVENQTYTGVYLTELRGEFALQEHYVATGNSSYRKEIIIAHTSIRESQTNYQMKLLVGESSSSEAYEYYIAPSVTCTAMNDDYWWAQTFTPQISHAINYIKLNGFKKGSPGTITVSIRNMSLGAPVGNDLCSGTYDGNTLNDLSLFPSSTVFTVFMNVGTSLIAGTQYAIVIRAPDGDANNRFDSWVGGEFDPGYSGGAALFSNNSGSTWYIGEGNEDYDLYFEEGMGAQVGCEGKVSSDFDDLRFTTSNGTTLCDYWIESITGTTPNQLATIWIEVPLISAAVDTTIYMCYGDPTASAVSSGANTFMVFDDFERGVAGDALGGSWSDTTGIATDKYYGGTRSARTGNAAIPVTHSDNIAIQFRHIKTSGQTLYFRYGDGATVLWGTMNLTDDITVYDGAAQVDTTLNSVSGVWGLTELKAFDWGAQTITWVEDGVSKTGIDMSFVSTGYPDTFTLQSSINFYMDNFIVRKFTPPNDPTWSSFGSQESMLVLDNVSWRGQTFSPVTNHTIGYVGATLYRDPGATGTLTMEIRSCDFYSGNGWTRVSVDNQTLCSGSVAVSSLSSSVSSPSSVVVELNTPVSLVAGQNYALIIHNSNSTNVNWTGDLETPTYTRGRSLSSVDSGSTWTADISGDLSFVEWSKGGSMTMTTDPLNPLVNSIDVKKAFTDLGDAIGIPYWQVIAFGVLMIPSFMIVAGSVYGVTGNSKVAAIAAAPVMFVMSMLIPDAMLMLLTGIIAFLVVVIMWRFV